MNASGRPGDQGRILQLERAARRVARIGERFLVAFFLLAVQFLEARLGHVDLAAHLDSARKAAAVETAGAGWTGRFSGFR